MKGSEHFTRVITEYLNQRAMTDPLFALNLTKEHKSIDECITYILTEVYKSGCSGFDDSEIFGMAVHYYDEDDIVVEGNPSISSVVVNHHIELTDEEKAEARQAALHRYQNEQYQQFTRRAKASKAKQAEVVTIQKTLFDL